MKLTYTAVFADLVNDFYQKNEILVICLAVIVLLLLFIMIFISISKSKHVQALKRMNEVAEESRQLQNAFIANMTHEIRTPLNVIVGFTTILAETDNLDKEQRVAFLKEINENKDVLLQLVNDLLDYSKIEANTMEYNDGEVDVNALILETCIAENAHSRLPGIQAEFVEKLPDAVAHQCPALDVAHTVDIGKKVIHYVNSPRSISFSTPVIFTFCTTLCKLSPSMATSM